MRPGVINMGVAATRMSEEGEATAGDPLSMSLKRHWLGQCLSLGAIRSSSRDIPLAQTHPPISFAGFKYALATCVARIRYPKAPIFPKTLGH